MGRFIGKVSVTWLEDEGSPDRTMQLNEDFAYEANDGTVYKAPAGEKIDGASIPKFFWRFIGPPFVGDYRRASVIHDYLSRVKITSTHKDTHKLFCEMIKTDGVKKTKRGLMCFAVKFFGPKWNNKKKK